MTDLRFTGDHLGLALSQKLSIRPSNRTIYISDLPPELLAHIFLATVNDTSVCRCNFARHDYVHPTTILSVCRTWHHISLTLPQLWSHIDLVTEWARVADAQCNLIRLMNERSAGASLDLCIQARTVSHLDLSPQRRIYLPITQEVLAPLEVVLTPLASRIRRLHIASDTYAAAELQPFLACVPKLCANGTVDTLDIHSVSKGQPSTALLRWTHFHGPIRLPSSHQIDAFMSPIRVLRLQNVWIPAESSVYTDLVELSLISTDTVRLWTRKQVAQILSSCSGLRWLPLKNVYPGEDSSPIGPIHLKQLQRVELVCDDPNRLAPLLQLLRLEGRGLAIKVDVCKEPKFVEQFRAFIGGCSNVATLSVRPKDGKAWFAPLRHGLSGLPMLTLEHCDFEDPDLVQYEETGPGPAVPWPCLRNLRLEHCIIQLDLLDFLTGSRYFERLVLVQCKVRNPHSEDPIPVVLSEITRQLAHSDIVITVDDGVEN